VKEATSDCLMQFAQVEPIRDAGCVASEALAAAPGLAAPPAKPLIGLSWNRCLAKSRPVVCDEVRRMKQPAVGSVG
jgi:hypothetical protein